MFRREATVRQQNSLTGDVAIVVPVAWQSIGFLISGGIAASILFLSIATYSRVQTVTGTIIPDAGVSAFRHTPLDSDTERTVRVSLGRIADRFPVDRAILSAMKMLHGPSGGPKYLSPRSVNRFKANPKMPNSNPAKVELPPIV